MEEKKKKKKNKKSKKKIIIILIIVLIIAFFIIKGKMASQNVETGPTTDVIEKRSISTTITATGKFESTTSQNMDSILTGKKVKEVKVKVGDKVTKDQILCTFDVGDVKDSYNLAASSLETTKQQGDITLNAAIRSRNDLQKSKDDYNNLKSTVDSLGIQISQLNQEIVEYTVYLEQAKLENDPEKMQIYQDTLNDLNRRLGESTQNLAVKQAEFQTVSATYNESAINSQIETANDQIRSAELANKSAIEQSANQVNTLKDQLDNGVIKALVDGTVTQVNVKEGENFAGGSVIKVEGINDFKITAQISEYDIPDIKVGMKVRIKSDATREKELKGTVTFVAPSATTVDTTSLASASGSTSSSPTYKIEISVDEPNERLRIGMTAKLSIVKEEAIDVLTVPYDAIYTRDDGTYYIKVQNDDETEKEITITKGLESDYYTEIKSEEIKEGMKVIVPDLSNTDALGEMINGMGATTGL